MGQLARRGCLEVDGLGGRRDGGEGRGMVGRRQDANWMDEA